MFFCVKGKENIRILEVGCGSGANLWLIAKEGFDAYGLDASSTAINLAQKHITEKWGGTAKLQVGRFDNLPYDNDYFDVVFDIVSLQHLDLETSRVALMEINRVLKDKGLFFSYRFSDGSYMFMNSGGQFLDAATIFIPMIYP